LHAGIDAGVAVSEGGAGDVDAVGAEVDGAAGMDEVVDSNAALRGEVEDAGVGVGAVVLRVVREATVGGVLVIGPDETAGGLAPSERNDLYWEKLQTRDGIKYKVSIRFAPVGPSSSISSLGRSDGSNIPARSASSMSWFM